MLNKEIVTAEEERLRNEVNQLDNIQRKAFYSTIKELIKDPDTYAVLCWGLIMGLHHFYLGKWERGIIDVLASCLGLFILITFESWLGVTILAVVAGMSLWRLFRSQVIIRDWNNSIYRNVLAKTLNKTLPPEHS